jgi:hypothetical protein
MALGWEIILPRGGVKIERLVKGYNTNLAAEFYVLSMLHRLGAEANLTLGNKKSVDIVVVIEAGDTITVDVEGLAGKTGWPVDNFRDKQKHFLIFICFLDEIDNPQVAPEAYIVPSNEVATLIYNAPGGRKLVRLSKLRATNDKYRDAWKQLL